MSSESRPESSVTQCAGENKQTTRFHEELFREQRIQRERHVDVPNSGVSIEKESKPYAMQKADKLINKIPEITRSAASDGSEKAQIMEVSGASNYRNEGPPQLDQAQQKVFDALKQAGLNPSVEKEYYHDPDEWYQTPTYLKEHEHDNNSPDRAYESWVINANWKDGQNPNAELQALAHDGQKRQHDQELYQVKALEQYDLRKANEAIAKIPELNKRAIASGAKSAQIMEISSAYGETPPKLSVGQQKVFDTLQALGLKPSIQKEFYDSDWRDLDRNYESWVIKSNL